MLVKNIVTPLSIIILLSAIELIEPVRYDVNEMMYLNIPGASACFRRLNGTHQFGCSSPFKGAYGVLQVLYDTTSVDEFIRDAVAGPYIVVMQPLLFSRGTIDKLVASNKVNGVILAWYSNSTLPDNYSPDDACPNRNEGFCDANQPWNPDGNRFLITDWPIPVFLVHDDVYLSKITQCYKDFNLPVDSSQLSKPLCMLQLKSHMYAAVSSEVCMRRAAQQIMSLVKFCDPMGNENIIYPMINLSELPSGEKKLIAVIARLDGASLFDGLAPGAMSAASGTASLIVLASIIKDNLQVIRAHSLYKGLIFMLLNGESFDYMGSERVVYDMEQGTFMTTNNKISLNDIGMVIELSQLGPGKEFYIHRTNHKEASDFADSLVEISKDTSVEFKLSSLPLDTLPPVSLSTFLKANSSIAGIVLTNYDKSFANRYYNGIFDNAVNLKYTVPGFDHDLPPKGSTQYNLASAASVVARGLVKSINKDESIIYDIKLSQYIQSVDDLLHCYLVSRKCKLFEKLYPTVGSNPTGPEVLSLYVGIPTSVNHITRATWKVLDYLATPLEKVPQENCTALCSKDEDLHCYWVKEETGNGSCVMSPIRLHMGVSPAFEIENYNWSSGKYSTWTESVWSETTVRMFIKGDDLKEIVVFVSGLVILLASLVSVYFINKKSDTLFAPIPETNC